MLNFIGIFSVARFLWTCAKNI